MLDHARSDPQFRALRPAIEALSALPEAECERRTTTELLVLRREGIA